jgi:hypothetical protein
MEESQTQLEKKLQVAEKEAARHSLLSISKKSFIKLCKMGCDPQFLSARLFTLRSTTQAEIVTRLGKGAVNRTTKHITSLRPLDSPETSLGGFKPDDLEKFKERIVEIALTMESISFSPVVSEVLKGYSFDVRNLPELLLLYANEILPSVRKLIKKTGLKYKPDYNRNLREIVEHIKDATGQENYKLIADILEGVGIDTNEEAIKQNIYRQRSAKGGNVK